MVTRIVEMINRASFMTNSFDANVLAAKFGEQFEAHVSLARYTSARIGGLADGLLTANSVADLDLMARFLWEQEIPFIVLGGGSNVLVSDAGMRGLVLLNKARQVVFKQENDPPTVQAASGSNFGVIARQAAKRGLSGLEWASGIPGTIGGAIVGNAGAHGGDIAGNLLMAEILHREMEDKRSKNGNPPSMVVRREEWQAEKFDFAYRSSLIKREQYGTKRIGGTDQMGRSDKKQPDFIILTALLRLAHSTKEVVEARIEKFVSQRQQTQPPGASMGSMFKNPEGDFAGRLIDQAGLKGTRIGDAAISSLHANFFINYGNASARDVWELINLARTVVSNKFGIDLELEIELVGSWEAELN